MFLHKITLPDGTALDSSVIRSVQLTEQVNDETDLCPGAACAACAEIELWAPRNGLTIAQGNEFTLVRIDAESGAQTPVGVFLAEKPVKTSANVIKVTAYDRMTLLDKNLSPWLREQQGAFPMTVKALVQAACAQCGVELAPGTLEAQVNTGYSVPAFYTDDLTGRQIIQWAAQAMCRFARMTPAGQLEFAWYTDHARSGIGPGSGSEWTALDLSGQLLATVDGEIWTFAQPQAGYYSGTLSYEDYTTAPIDKVQIRQSDDDVGVIYPADETATNALVLQGNLLLTTQTADALRPVAQAIYEQMQGVTYTPLQVSIPLTDDAPAPGETLTVADAYGRRMQTYIMSQTISGQRVTLESTGNARRDGTAAVNSKKWRNLQGKMLKIEADVDGLEVTASDLQGNYTQLSQTVDGLTVKASDLSGKYTELSQTVDGLTVTAGNLQDDYTQLSQTVDGLDLTVVKKGQVRTQFAADADSVDITSGLISFKSNTLAVDSSNFKLNAAGNVTAAGSFSSNNGVGGAGRNESTLSSGSIAFRRTTSAGQNLLAAEVYGLGANAAHGCMNIYGTDASNNNNIGQFIVQGSYTGGQVWIRNAAGQNEITLFGGNGGNAGFEGNVDIKGETGLGVSKNISCQSINIWGGEKSRVVPTSFGPLKMAAFETPEPTFADSGSAVCDASGICCLTLHPKFAETISAFQELKWLVTPTAPGSLWVEKRPNGAALIHGDPGQTFDWLCMGAQVGFDAQYAERTEYDPPNDHNPAYGQLDLLDVFAQETQRELDSLLQYPDYISVEDELLKGELV